jgi:acyl-CoA synthetase (AMP-forming)/AMP-acid ligase II
MLPGDEIDSRRRASALRSDLQPEARSLQPEKRLADAFLAVAASRASCPAVITPSGSHDYAAVGEAARRVAQYLRNEHRLAPGGRVLLLLNNGPEYLAAFYGTLLTGGVVVPMPPSVETSRLARVIELCHPEVVLATADTAGRRKEPGFAATVQAEHECRMTNDGMTNAESQVRPPHLPFRHSSFDHSLAMILFTSGSSGEPKGVMLSHANLLANARSILGYLPIRPDDRALALLPFYHAFGNSVLQTHVLRGATLVVDGSAAFPSTITDALRRHDATSLSAVPEIYHGLLTHSDLGSAPLPTLRYMTVAGGALAPALVREVAYRIAPAQFYVMYGQTEATARLAWLPPEEVLDHADSIGRAIPGVTLRIASDDGAEAPPGTVGELQARGPNIMLGYWQDPAGTAAAIQDGWLRTGDLAAADERGLIRIQGRRNDLVKVQGIRLHPAEIEEVIARRWPGCRAVVVPYQSTGGLAAASSPTRLAAFVVPCADGKPTAEEVRRHCLAELPRPKVPSHVETVSELPLNASLKVDRAALSRRAEAACAATLTPGGEA